MNFKAIQDAVIKSTFDESDRADIKTWINHRYGTLMDQNEWTFTQGTANVTVTAGSQAVSNLPVDLGIVLGLQRVDGTPLEAIPEYRKFAARFLGASNAQAGRPCAFTSWGGQVLVGPTSNESSAAYLLTYEKNVTLLDDDTDIPVLPAEYHLALVFGAKADGAKLSSILLADPFEQQFDADVQAMTRKYLVSVRGANTQMPAYRPG